VGVRRTSSYICHASYCRRYRVSARSANRPDDATGSLWLIEAVKYNVLPLDDRRIERFNSDIAGRPVLVKGNSQILYGGMGRLSENSVIDLKNKSHAVTAELIVPDGGGQGAIIAQGGAFAGWCLYLNEGKPKYCHNLAGRGSCRGDRPDDLLGR
jgi:hypothetical protein